MEIPNKKHHSKDYFEIKQNKSHCIIFDPTYEETAGECIGHAVFSLPFGLMLHLFD